ncbi:MAG: ABC transporter ATP-binding protein [Alphaproteobacteria bacterium]
MTNKPYPREPLKFLWIYATKNKALVFSALFFGFLEISFSKLSPFLFSRITGLFNNDATFDNIKSKLFLFLTLFVLAEICQRIVYYFGRKAADTKLGPKIYKEVSSDLFLYLQGHSLEYFANNMAGKLADKIKGAADASTHIYVTSMYFIKWILDFVIMIFMFAAANLYFGFLYAITLIVFTIFALLLSKRINVKRKSYADYKSKVSGQFIDSLQNNFFVKIFNGQKHEEKILEESMQIEKKKIKAFVTERTLQDQSKNFILYFINLVFLFYAVFLWKNHKMKTEDLVYVFMLAQYSAWTMNSILHFIIGLTNKMAELYSYLDVFATKHDITDSTNKKLKINSASIEFKNITFGYNPQINVFNKFNLKIEAGEKIGIVGASGCGKTTLVSLLQRLYELKSGDILINDKSIKDVTQDSLCQNISYISQQSLLFKRSIKDNIAYGKTNAKKDEVIKASKNAYAHSFIKDLENGYNTTLSGDKKLSGGQMQRIAIARSLLENAPVLVLDEATSSLDSQSEDFIQKAITKLIKNKTVIAIAHRLSTLKNMDRIIVLENGKIIEDGTINELLKQKGKFAEFWNMQKLVEEKDGN